MRRITILILVCCFLAAVCAPGIAEERTDPMKIQIETVSTDGFTMDFFRFGQGAETLVILPGLSVDSVMNYADAVAEAYALLTDDFTVYVFDRRKELPGTYSVYDMARDTAAAFRALGLDRVCLFGASQGGMIAMTVAAEHPQLVGKMILGSTAARVTDERYRVIDGWVRLAKTGNAKDLYLDFGAAVYPKDVFEQSLDALAAAAETVTEAGLKRFVILAEGTKGFDVTDRLRNIACPVLVIGSEDDCVLGAEASVEIVEELKGRPDCELYMYDGYGHAAYDLAPDYRERMLRFLKP